MSDHVANTATEHIRPIRARVSTLVVLAIALWSATADAQVRGRRGRPAQDEEISVFVETSPTIANLFSRADEGAARNDWKFTIDCLQRVIDNPQGSLVARGDGAAQNGVLYESARQRAVRLVASLPPEGLSAYRLLFDGRAKRLLERGRSEHNPDDLWEVVHRYLLTRLGDDAADLLASWALDAGRPSEAARILIDLLALVPDADVPRELTTAKLAAAYALLGQSDKAWALMADGEAKHGSSPALSRLGDSLPGRIETEAVDPLAAWPVAGGSTTRRGIMPSVEPAIVEFVPWQYELPGAPANAWRRAYLDDPQDRLVLPTAQPIADNKRLFVRTPQGCVALDRNDLLERWRINVSDLSPDASITVAPLRRSQESVTDHLSGFGDHVTADMASGFGLVIIVARDGEGNYTPNPRDKGTVYDMQWIPTGDVQRRTAVGTQIIALDAATGRMVWQRGRTGHPGDPLGDVDFRSAPLGVAGRFWVPYFRQNDLYVAVLRPADGTLIDSVLLCSIGADTNSRYQAADSLPPAAADGVVFVPSGYGILFGLDAYDHTLKWAGQYDKSLTHDALRGATGPSRWIPGPPVIAGELALVGAKESGSLHAFSSATGEFRWSAQPRGAAYIIGADHDHVWVGGRSVACVSLIDGKTIWSAETPSTPTGRGVLAADIVYVPTLDGLLSLDAGTGDTLEYAALPTNDDPPGNLLSLDHGLLMAGPSGVRRFPDIDKSYPIALAKYEGDPQDASFAIRLAWIELLRGKPQRGFDILETLASPSSTLDRVRESEAVRLRVEALLAIAEKIRARGGTEEEALGVLTRAAKIARTPRDQLRCGLAIAHKLSMLGRHVDAYQRLWDLGVGTTGAQIVPLGEHVRGMARFDIAQRLAKTSEKLTAAERQHILESASRTIADIVVQLTGSPDPRDATARLRAIADLDNVGPVRSRASAEIASYYTMQQQYEKAEQLLRYADRSGTDPASEAANLVKLCSQLAQAESLGVPAAAAVLACLDDLDAHIADVTLPDSVLTDIADEIDASAPKQSVKAWARKLRSKMYTRLGIESMPTDDDALELNGQFGWSLPAPNRASAARLVRISENGPTTLGDRVFFQASDRVVSCKEASSGELLWKTTLRLPESFISVARPARRPANAGPRRAVADGQTAVFRTNEGLFGVGLATGRRLWARAFDATALVGTKGNPDMWMAAEDGLLAAMPNDGRLALIRMLDGETLWERDLRGETVEFIQMHQGRVVTMDQGQRRVHIFDRDNGHLVKQVLFDQPDPTRGVVPLVKSGGILCGPATYSGSDGIQGVDIVTGEVIWQSRVDKPVAGLFEPRKGYLGVGLFGGNVRIIDAATGNQLIEHNVPGAHAVVDGALVSGTLLVRHFASRKAKNAQTISAIDLATGEEIWKRTDLVSSAKIDDPLRIYGDRLIGAKRGEKPRKSRPNELRFQSIDVRTGQPVGLETSIIRANEAINLNGDFCVYPLAGVAVVGTERAVLTLKIGAPSDGSREGL